MIGRRLTGETSVSRGCVVELPVVDAAGVGAREQRAVAADADVRDALRRLDAQRARGVRRLSPSVHQ